MRVLVTGGTGFIGPHVIKDLLSHGHEVRAMVRSIRPHPYLSTVKVEFVEGDLLDHSSLDRACAGMEGLIHCAANGSFWSKFDDLQRRINVDGTEALLRSAKAAGLKRIVHVSSVATIGIRREPIVLDESTPWNSYEANIHYILTKHEGEQRALAAAKAGQPVVVVNPAAVLGPRLDSIARSSLVNRIRDGRIRFAPPGGTSVTDVEDVARAIVSALERGRVGERYILAGHNKTWAEFFNAIAERNGIPRRFHDAPRIIGRTLEFLAVIAKWVGLGRPTFAPEIYRFWGWYVFLDSSKAKRELGYVVRPFEEIVRRVSEAAPT